MQIQQLEAESNLGQNIALDSPASPDKKRLDSWLSAFQCPGNREARVEVPTRSAPGKDDPHRGQEALGMKVDQRTSPREILFRVSFRC